MRTKFSSVTIVVGLLAVGVILLLAACNGGGDDADGETPPAATDEPGVTQQPETIPGDANGGVVSDIDPCSLVTQEEAAAALGGPVSEPETFGSEDIAECAYFLAESDHVPGIDEVRVTVFFADSEDDLRVFFDIGKDLYEPVDGVGEEAYWETPRELNVWSGGNYFTIFVDIPGLDVDDETGLVGGEHLAAATDLATTALTRLP